MMKFYLYPICLLFIFFSCKQKASTPAAFELVENTGIDFSNNIKNTKDFNVLTYRNFYNGAGVLLAILIMMDWQIFFLPPTWVQTNCTSIKEIFNLKIFH